MKTSIWLNNKNHHFEIFNTAECLLEIGEKFVHLGRCKKYDLVSYNPKNFEKSFQVIYEGKSKEEVDYVIKFISHKLYEKSQLLQQIGALKRMKNKEVNCIIEKIKNELRYNYFEINIIDIVDQYHKLTGVRV